MSFGLSASAAKSETKTDVRGSAKTVARTASTGGSNKVKIVGAAASALGSVSPVVLIGGALFFLLVVLLVFAFR